MAARDSMADLIDRVRYLIGDTGSTEQFTDAHINDILDMHRSTVRYCPLQEIEDIDTGGTVTYKEFWAIGQRGRPVRNWEGTAGTNLFFVDGQWGTVTPATFNYIEGKFRFTEAPNRPVRLTGFHYDIEGAAADLCEEWAAAVKACVTFSDGSDKIALSDKFTHLMTLAENFRRRQKPLTVAMTRSDINRGGDYDTDDPRLYNSRLPRG